MDRRGEAVSYCAGAPVSVGHVVAASPAPLYWSKGGYVFLRWEAETGCAIVRNKTGGFLDGCEVRFNAYQVRPA